MRNTTSSDQTVILKPRRMGLKERQEASVLPAVPMRSLVGRRKGESGVQKGCRRKASSV